MTAVIRHAILLTTLALMGGLWTDIGVAQAADEQAPSYLAKQASDGRKAYTKSCAVCHGANLKGLHLAPGLVGDKFDQTWRGKSADVLSFHLRRMPIDPVAKPGSLSDEDYTNILAYIFRSNGIKPGKEALPNNTRALGSLIIPGGLEFDGDSPVGGQSELLDNLPDVTDAMLLNPSPGDWLQWGRTYDGQSFSPLEQINKDNVANLKLAWRAPLRNGESMPTPLVHHGVMYLHTFPGTVLAMDASNGMVLWRYQRTEASRPTKKAGLGLHGDKVLVPTSDLHVIALNAKTGGVLWDHTITTETDDKMRGRYQLRSAPIVVGDKVIQGITASGAPKGGFILAVDINSGEEVWRFNTIARPGEPEGDTWNGVPLERRSGGSVWHHGTYDAELNLIYYGIAPTYDTGPLLHSVNKEGITNNAMYTNCTVALDADTGELVWSYQHMANDQWDLDWAFERQIATVTVDGKPRKVVMNVGKMAILEALDAETGEYLFSVDPGVQNVITAINPTTGTKTIDPDKLPDLERPCVVCPSAFGARSWPPTSYSPRTKFAYIPITEWCMGMEKEGFKLLSSGVGLTSKAHPDVKDGMMGRLQAIDVEKQEVAWTADLAAPPTTAMLSTAGGLLFSGDVDRSLKAFDDATGELLWDAPLDDLPSSSVVSYTADDKQYVAIVVGLTNNHVRDTSNAYYEFSPAAAKLSTETPKGGAAVWVFALE